jgi:hypothetical protein
MMGGEMGQGMMGQMGIMGPGLHGMMGWFIHPLRLLMAVRCDCSELGAFCQRLLKP